MKGDKPKKKRKKYKVRLFGLTYDLPVTPETAPFIALLEGDLKPWASTKGLRDWSRKSLAERGMREIIATLLHQVRDSVGEDVTSHILQEIKDKLEPMVNRRVQGDMRKALPAPQKVLLDGKSRKA